MKSPLPLSLASLLGHCSALWPCLKQLLQPCSKLHCDEGAKQVSLLYLPHMSSAG